MQKNYQHRLFYGGAASKRELQEGGIKGLPRPERGGVLRLVLSPVEGLSKGWSLFCSPLGLRCSEGEEVVWAL